MDQEKVTILLISKDNSPVKSLEINSKYVINYKTYLKRAIAAVSIIIIFIAALFAYAVKQGSENFSLRSQVSEFDKKIEIADSLKLKEKLNKIDNNLALIDSYLKSRGIIPEPNIGGEPSTRHVSNVILLQSVEDQSVVFSNLIRSIPMGVPYNGRFSSDYGYRRNPFGGYSGEFHPGIDIKGELGDPIFATADGFVDRCDWYGGYGNAVLLRHSFGYQTLYGHMSKVNVEQGQEIKSGDLIGFMGSTGRSTGTHVHYEIRKDGIDIDPVPYIKLN
jgi:murein DD-endopeptidase MepM/ murein hydrolase activator NlpD